MRKRLFATTAIAAIGLVGGVAGAQTQKAGPITMKVGGFFDSYYAFASQDDGTGRPGFQRRRHGLFREAEVIFAGRTTLDNGLAVGVEIQIEAEDCLDPIDESVLYFESAYGRLEVGGDDGAPEKMYYGAPSVAGGLGVNDPTFQFLNRGGNALILSDAKPGNISGDNEKLTYFTPRVAGFQLGISYTPQPCQEGNQIGSCGGAAAGMGPNGASASADSFRDTIETGLNYVAKHGDVGVAIGGAFGRGRNQNPSAGREDRTEWGFGGQVSYMGFSVGGAYRFDNRGFGANGDQTDWNAGVGYATGPWAFSLAHGEARQEQTAGGSDRYRTWELAGAYALGPGINLTAAVIHGDWDDNLNDPASENSAWALALGTNVKF